MNLKRKFQFAYSILLIVLGVYLVIDAFTSISLVNEYNQIIASLSDTTSEYYLELKAFIDAINTTLTFYYMIGVTIIILSSLSLRNKPSKGSAISQMILISILFLYNIGNVSIINELLDGYFNLSYFNFMNLLSLASIAFLITYLSIKDEKKVVKTEILSSIKSEKTNDEEQHKEDQNEKSEVEQIANTDNIEIKEPIEKSKGNEILPDKIKILKELKDMGEINEEEYKKLLMKELAK